ncbi:MAG: hypothetical protein U0325_27700 [Polyangiales bacterium]
MKVPRGGLLARTLAATLTGLLVVGALAAAVGAERAIDHARHARVRELRLFAVATAARMQPLSPTRRAHLAQRLSATTRLDATVLPLTAAPPRSAPLRRRTADGRVEVEVTEALDARGVLRVCAHGPTPRPSRCWAPPRPRARGALRGGRPRGRREPRGGARHRLGAPGRDHAG